ncbi:MAG: SGNH/GDSL hydrolase family protein [Ruminococcus sp.]|nr:SGNH/GDSL hydrolase family protein [Ruminococcus sp.]
MNLLFPTKNIELNLGDTITFDQVSGKLSADRIEGDFDGKNVTFDNTDTDLESTKTEDAIKEVNDKVNHLPSVDAYTKQESDQKYATKSELSNKADVSAIPTKTSQLQNDSNFASIDDTQTLNNKVWSSKKTYDEIENVVNNRQFVSLTVQYSPAILVNNGYVVQTGISGYSVSTLQAINKTARYIVIPYAFNPPNVNTHCVIGFFSTNLRNSFISGVVGNTPKGLKVAIPDGANYFCVTVPDSEPFGEYYQYTKDIDLVTDRLYSKGAYTIKGNMSSNTKFEIPQTNCKDNQVYSFTATADDFSNLNLIIGHGKTAYESCYITITPTNCDFTRYTTSANTTTNAHGLTLSKFIDVKILVTKHGIAKVVIQTADDGNGVYEYVLDITNWTGCSGDANNEVFTFAELVSGSLSDCVFCWSCSDFRKQLWAFGDSYFAYLNTRWLYYLEQDGFYDNILVNGQSGENTAKAIIALKNMLGYFGKPKYILWCMGQNDGSDTTVANYNNWVTKIEEVINICKANDITPILCTIPSVPKNGGRSHELKNAWIRSSGYRYVDMAKSVGAEWNNGSVTWYPNMLASDDEHPDIEGGKAIEKRMLMDCPELTFEN